MGNDGDEDQSAVFASGGEKGIEGGAREDGGGRVVGVRRRVSCGSNP